MTDRRELLAMLSVGVPAPDPIPGAPGRPASEVLRPEDIAAALQGVPRGPYLLVRWKYAGDWSVASEFTQILEDRIARLAERKVWSRKKPERLRGMAQLALIEAELIPQLCRKCKGRREIMVRKPKVRWIDCPVCEGTGRHKMSEHARASMTGIPWESWRRTWRGRQDNIKGMLIQWEWFCVRKLIQRMKISD